MTGPTTGGSDGGAGRDVTDEIQERVQAFGREAQVAGERLGREAQAAGERLSRDPGVIAFGTWVTRLWGLVLIAVGVWFLGEFSLGWDMPAVDWNMAWPAALIVLGGLVIVSAVLRRR